MGHAGKEDLGETVEMIPAERMEAYSRRLCFLHWSVAGWGILQVLFIPAMTIWIMLARNGNAPMPGMLTRLVGLVIFFILPFIILIGQKVVVSWRAIRCSVCGNKIKGGLFGQLVKTGRCTSCHTHIAVPQAHDMSGEESSKRRIPRRVLLLIAFVGVGGTLIFWMAAGQLIPAAVAWALLGAMAPALVHLCMHVWMPVLMIHNRRKRQVEESLLTEIVPVYPLLTVLRTSESKARQGPRAFQMFFVPSGLRFGRLCNKLHFFNPMARQMEDKFGVWQTREHKDKRRREVLYRSIDPTGTDFFELDAENFEISREAIAELVYEAVYEWTWLEKRRGAVGSGYLHIENNDGVRQTYIVTDELSQDEATAMLADWTKKENSVPKIAGIATD